MFRLAVLRVFLLVIAALSACVSAQQPNTPEAALPMITLHVTSSVNVANAPATGLFVPLQCAADGSILVRFAPTSSLIGIYGISPEGEVVTFKPEPMSEITNAIPVSFFPTDKRVFVLLLTSENKEMGRVHVSIEGQPPLEKSMPKQAHHFYIAEFDSKGKYLSVVNVDLPFTPTRLGAFPSGAFLVAGYTPDRQRKIALLRADGHFDRYLQFNLPPGQETQPGTPRTAGELANADFVLGGDKLLLFYRYTANPILEVSASGEITSLALSRIPKGYTIFSLMPSGSRWVVTLTRSSDRHRFETLTYAVNPNDGVPVAEYAYPTPIGLGLGCVHDGDFLALKADPETDLPVLTKLSPQ